jgi:hypothetical protein
MGNYSLPIPPAHAQRVYIRHLHAIILHFGSHSSLFFIIVQTKVIAHKADNKNGKAVVSLITILWACVQRTRYESMIVCVRW